MSEEVASMPQEVESTPVEVETIPQQPETTPEKAEEPLPKRRGRPKGAADKQPRRKKVIVVEPLAPGTPPAPAAAESRERSSPSLAAPAPAPSPEIEPEEPMSPRTVLRAASHHILEMRRLEQSARKSHLHDMYSRNLRAL